jgi:hypothetical protein
MPSSSATWVCGRTGSPSALCVEDLDGVDWHVPLQQIVGARHPPQPPMQ